MRQNEIRDRIAECCTLFGFEYQGKEGNVDPYYTQEEGYSYLLYFDGSEQTVYSLDDVMNTPFIDGHTLRELAEQVNITEW